MLYAQDAWMPLQERALGSDSGVSYAAVLSTYLIEDVFGVLPAEEFLRNLSRVLPLALLVQHEACSGQENVACCSHCK